MTDEELGKMTTEELENIFLRDAPSDVGDELRERFRARQHGKPGVSPLLSRRVVREMRGKLQWAKERSIDAKGDDPYWHGVQDGIEIAARWLLALPDDAPSPLEDES